MGMIQIRNVPEILHREFKARAAKAGMSLSEYLLAEMRQLAERPTMEEIRARLQSLPEAKLSVSTADLIREERGPI